MGRAALARCDRCDFDFLRREVVYINYVRDRRDAHVHVLVTTERAGAGWEFTLNFIGLEGFADFEESDIIEAFHTEQKG